MFDFQLTPQEEKRAQQLHAECVVTDMLFQYVGGASIYDHLPPGALERALAGKSSLWEKYLAAQHLPFDLAIKGECQTVHTWWLESGVNLASIGIPLGGISQDQYDPHWVRLVPWMRQVTRVDEIRAAKAAGMLAVYGNCQPTYGIPPRLEAIDIAYDNGLRVLMLTYNRMDYVGAGCTERVDAGLSRYGLQVVEHCNRLGILIDTSHCGRQTTLDACRFSRAPVLANHTGAAALYPHARGKSDEELEALARTGGVVGIYAVPFFLCPGIPTIEAMLDHVDYVVDLIGWEHVGIGTDWPLQCPQDVLRETVGGLLAEVGFRPEDNIDVTQTLIGYRDSRDFPNITRGLVKRGYADEQIRGILGENFLRVFGQVCG